MSSGQPTGAVGSLRWDSKVGGIALEKLEEAVRVADFFVRHGTSQSGRKMIPNAGPAGDSALASGSDMSGNANNTHCTPELLLLVECGSKLIRLRKALRDALGHLREEEDEVLHRRVRHVAGDGRV